MSLAPCPTGRDNCWLQSLREFLQPRAIVYMNTQTHNKIYYYNIMHTLACCRYYYNLFEFSSLLSLEILYSFPHVPLKKSNDSFVSLTVFGSCGTTPSASPNSVLSNFDRLPATFNDSYNNIYTLYTHNVN